MWLGLTLKSFGALARLHLAARSHRLNQLLVVELCWVGARRDDLLALLVQLDHQTAGQRNRAGLLPERAITGVGRVGLLPADLDERVVRTGLCDLRGLLQHVLLDARHLFVAL